MKEILEIINDEWRLGLEMPTIDEIATAISLEDGESITVQWDRKDDVEANPGRMGGTTFTFHVIDEQGRPATLGGGSRLMDAIRGLDLPNKGSVLLNVTAHGEAGTVERTWEVELG